MKFWRNLKRLLYLAAAAVVLTIALIVGLRLWVHRAYRQKIVAQIEEVKPVDGEPRVAIVFGAGLWSGGTPSPVLYDRIETAVDLYRAGRVQKLLLTGDNRFQNYNEPAVMRRTALELGVPAEDLVPDYAGRRTYDSCYRAREIYGVRRAVLVTQAFHLDRAMYLCESFGIDSVGVAADRQTYGSASRQLWNGREVLATAGAWLDLHVLRPVPILGDKITVFDRPPRQTDEKEEPAATP
ncbi:MAG TPA: ElyC/SanA/YdcF family protein [Pyrinomonadaceae bacterium]|nr:ElyC/SanA/YdcF family protein [Pyrinomonadaceae bacterium]